MLLSAVFAEPLPWRLRHTIQTAFGLYYLSFLHAASCPALSSAKEALICAKVLLSHQLYTNTAVFTTLGLHQTQALTSHKATTTGAQKQGPDGWSCSDPTASADEGWPREGGGQPSSPVCVKAGTSFTAGEVCYLDDGHACPSTGHRQWRPGSTMKPCFLSILYSS